MRCVTAIGYVPWPQGSEQFKQLQQQLSTVLTRALHKIRSKIANFEKQMGSKEESQAIQKQADMLTANIYRYTIDGNIMRDTCSG